MAASELVFSRNPCGADSACDPGGKNCVISDWAAGIRRLRSPTRPKRPSRPDDHAVELNSWLPYILKTPRG
jgi:hypothetical protein